MTDQTQASRIWQATIFTEMLRLAHVTEVDNFDVFRYPEEHRNAFFYQVHGEYLAFLVDNAPSLFAARELLSDAESQALFDQLVLYRLLGHLHVRLPFNTPDKIQSLLVPESWKVDDTGDTGMFGPLSIFSVPYRGDQVWVKGWWSNVSAAFLSGQYYYARHGVTIAPKQGDQVIDAGGCFGDTALAFAQDVGAGGKVYTFDPMQKHCEIMREAFQMNPRLASRIRIFDVGLADVDHRSSLMPDTSAAINPGARMQEGLPTRTIDSLVASADIERVDFIKMDIEAVNWQRYGVPSRLCGSGDQSSPFRSITGWKISSPSRYGLPRWTAGMSFTSTTTVSTTRKPCCTPPYRSVSAGWPHAAAPPTLPSLWAVVDSRSALRPELSLTRIARGEKLHPACGPPQSIRTCLCAIEANAS